MGLSKELFMNNRLNIGNNLPAGYEEDKQIYGEIRSSKPSAWQMEAWLWNISQNTASDAVIEAYCHYVDKPCDYIAELKTKTNGKA